MALTSATTVCRHGNISSRKRPNQKSQMLIEVDYMFTKTLLLSNVAYTVTNSASICSYLKEIIVFYSPSTLLN